MPFYIYHDTFIQSQTTTQISTPKLRLKTKNKKEESKLEAADILPDKRGRQDVLKNGLKVNIQEEVNQDVASSVSSVPGLTKSNNASCGVKANQQEIGETLSNTETDTEIELEKPKLSIGGDNSKPKEFKESAMLEVAPTTVSRSVGRITHSPDIADCGETVKFGETSLKECGKQDRNAQDKTATVHQHEEDIHTLHESALTTGNNENIIKEKLNLTEENLPYESRVENIANVDKIKIIELEEITLMSQRNTSSEEVTACLRYSEIFQHKINHSIVFNMAFPNTSKAIPLEEVTLISDTNIDFEEINTSDTDEHNLNDHIDFTYHPNTVCYRPTKLDSLSEQTSAKVIPKSEGTQPANVGHNNKGSTKAAVKENEDITIFLKKEENYTYTKIADNIADGCMDNSKGHTCRNITHEQHKGLERLEYAPEDLAERSPWSEIEELEDEAIAAIEAAARAVEGMAAGDMGMSAATTAVAEAAVLVAGLAKVAGEDGEALAGVRGVQARLQQLLNVAENNISSFGEENLSSFEENKLSSLEEEEEIEDKGSHLGLQFSVGRSSEFLYRLIMQAKRIKRKLNREELRRRQDEIQNRARAPVRGEVIEPTQNMREPTLWPEPMIQQRSNRWIKMDEYEKNENFLNALNIVYIKANAVAAVEAATRAVVGLVDGEAEINQAVEIVIEATRAVAALAKIEGTSENVSSVATIVKERLEELIELRDCVVEMGVAKTSLSMKQVGQKENFEVEVPINIELEDNMANGHSMQKIVAPPSLKEEQETDAPKSPNTNFFQHLNMHAKKIMQKQHKAILREKAEYLARCAWSDQETRKAPSKQAEHALVSVVPKLYTAPVNQSSKEKKSMSRELVSSSVVNNGMEGDKEIIKMRHNVHLKKFDDKQVNVKIKPLQEEGFAGSLFGLIFVILLLWMAVEPNIQSEE